MLNIIFRIVLTVGILLAMPYSLSSNAKYVARTVSIMGIVSCENWLKDVEATKAVGDRGLSYIPVISNKRWVLGLVSGLNSAGNFESDLLKNLDSRLVFDWVDKYCRANQHHDTYDAAKALLVQLNIISTKPKSK